MIVFFKGLLHLNNQLNHKHGKKHQIISHIVNDGLQLLYDHSIIQVTMENNNDIRNIKRTVLFFIQLQILSKNKSCLRQFWTQIKQPTTEETDKTRTNLIS